MNLLAVTLCAAVIAWLVMMVATVVGVRLAISISDDKVGDRPLKIVEAILLVAMTGMLVLFAWCACE